MVCRCLRACLDKTQKGAQKKELNTCQRDFTHNKMNKGLIIRLFCVEEKHEELRHKEEKSYS